MSDKNLPSTPPFRK